MKIAMKTFGMDPNGRSTWTTTDIPFKQISDTHYETEVQDGAYWGISLNQPGEPIGGGPHEMHLTNQPRMVWAMSGHLENRLQSGEVRRSATGEGVIVQGLALHHSSFTPTREPVITLSLTFPGTHIYTIK
jgi:hypothetical protein